MESLEQLEKNIHQLLNQYQELQLQVKALQEDNKRKQEEIIQAHADFQQLRQEYNKLHTAHTILLADEATAEDRAKAKQKFTNIILQIDKAIEAYYKAFGNQNEQVKLTIVGGGPEEKKLRKLISIFRLERSVILTGTLNRDETATRVAQADALVCSSRLETFGVPVIEAWACGLPVVATDALGFLEYWNDGLGEIVSNSNVDEMAAAMRKMHVKYNQYRSKQILEFAYRNFSEEVVYSRLVALYSEK